MFNASLGWEPGILNFMGVSFFNESLPKAHIRSGTEPSGVNYLLKIAVKNFIIWILKRNTDRGIILKMTYS